MDGGNSPSTSGIILNQAHGIRDDLNDIYSLLDNLAERVMGAEPPSPTTGVGSADPVSAPVNGALGEIQSVLRDCKRQCDNIRKTAGRLNGI